MKTLVSNQHLLIQLIDWAATITIALVGFSLLRNFLANTLMTLYRYFFDGVIR